MAAHRTGSRPTLQEVQRLLAESLFTSEIPDIVSGIETHTDAISLGETDVADVDGVSVGCHPDKQGKFSL
jgi:hypothetical protein